MSIHLASHRAAPLRALVLALLSVGMLLAVAGPAQAHSDEGEMEVLTAEPAGPLEISIEVGIVYANDDDLATEASVTVTATGPDGATVGPVDVPNTTDAKYGTTLGVPTEGVWSLTVTSTGPDAEQAVEVATSTAAPASETTASAPETTASDTTPASDTTDPVGSETTAAPVVADDDGDDDGSPLGLLVVVAVLVAGLAAFGMIILRGRSTDPSSEPGDDGGEP